MKCNNLKNLINTIIQINFNSRIMNKILFLIFSFLSFIANGQSSFVASANSNTASSNISYSIGQLLTTQVSKENITINHGVQQAFEIQEILSITETKDLLKLSIFPNPVPEFLKLDIKGFDFTNCYFSLVDINGKQLKNNIINKNQTIISMPNYKPAVYFLQIVKNGKKIKTFKIIKK
ncbi:T9SS type A sorting domain-containing protein [uncultured Polaribacter sp.]|uniref:T9SS type A sorting domain-containing protein n=1 Tax=uncultured Polaribacter sp. TaxID=174711 RepID=UPI00260D731A|nr:T9SS type A sorting domain-containing protein [uncultured Polaribacter sp.]